MVRGGRTVWSDGTLTVAAGAVVGVIGPNGAGKTTLFQVALGLLPVASGQRGGARRRPAARQPADRLRPAELHLGARRRGPLPRPRDPRPHRRAVRPAAHLGRGAGAGGRGARPGGGGRVRRPPDVGDLRRAAAAGGHRAGDRRRRRPAAPRRAAGQPGPAQPAGDRPAARRPAPRARRDDHGRRARPQPAAAGAHRGDLPARRAPAPRPDHRRGAGGAAHPPLRHPGRRRPDRAGRPVHPRRLARPPTRATAR